MGRSNHSTFENETNTYRRVLYGKLSPLTKLDKKVQSLHLILFSARIDVT